ncbi:IS66 Orf2 family protein [Ruminiclostridium papyrosolvens DSM 2782]|uniref:IS66 Orf2 family protein n=1 Tax=Ruminiclostridium papyrosolvens DSM 2782 TaxID=588581 RepID=F1TDK6_9FIRM|nr:IS66 family insertion sequence element accessory protein TnpB [Ruminiclostridium papyrosolvens]EGD47644.1 IS66 Orf2 family protein [Ruminiclostridium papyrosolvens DSM 2782]WES36390.1 IS66 family insertion sequence element accessory protein TnpB [Ruminiclostridium papyrosolvens DSM 2782]WES36412.1 IS66 family insertion sequence element accessory protein TnpB [Ruminiclostridium papyrosolvens DSM 2782]
MFNDAAGFDQIYIACGYTDLRCGIDGLAAIVQNEFKLNPFQNTLFLFCGRKTNRIKAILWEGDGFVLLYKRLESGRFQWPRSEKEARCITSKQFRWLTEGLSIDQSKAVKKSFPKHIL